VLSSVISKNTWTSEYLSSRLLGSLG